MFPLFKMYLLYDTEPRDQTFLTQGLSYTHARVISIIRVITQTINLNVCVIISLILNIGELTFGMNCSVSGFFITFF